MPRASFSRLRRLRRLRRSVLARRRPIAALCAAVAVAAALQSGSAAPPARTLVLTAARDLPAGVVVRPGDLARTPFDPASVPAGVLGETSAVGRTTAGPLRSGEPLTDARLVTRSLLEGYPGLVAVPVRIGDPGAVRLLRVGDRVDLLAADPQGETSARAVGRDVPVLAIPRPGVESPGLTNGALVVLGIPDGGAEAVAQASVSAFLSVVLTR
ncbi:MAG: SAF domain-containing protein [Nocardioidaceae bacterium]